MSKSKSKQEEALQLLDDLDSFTPLPEGTSTGTTNPTTTTTNPGEAEVLAFLDEITQKSSEPTRATTAYLDRPVSRSSTPTLRKSTERVKLGGSSLGAGASNPAARSATPPASAKVPVAATSTPDPAISGESGSRWGWGTVWNTASAAIQQAKTVVDEQVKNLPNNEQARKWGEGVMEYAKTHQLDKIGQDFRRVGLSTLNDILNVVAPPISEHEVIQVWLSHDMKGYDGVEALVYRALTRVMEQVEGGDLIVNKGEESRPKDDDGNAARDLNTVEGYDAAVKLAQANLDELIKIKHAQKPTEPSSVLSPTSYSYVYLRIQPYLTSYTASPSSALTESAAQPPESTTRQHLQFLLYLSDPSHNLIHSTITQAIPGTWLGIWDEFDWVEDLVAEALRVGMEVLGQEYIVSRMGLGGLGGKKQAASDASEASTETGETAQSGDEEKKVEES